MGALSLVLLEQEDIVYRRDIIISAARARREQEDIVYGRSIIISAARARGQCVW